MDCILNYTVGMSTIETEVRGVLLKDHTVIDDTDMQRVLEQKGFGQFFKKKFMLKSYEALYLKYINKLAVTTKNQYLSFQSLLEQCKRYDSELLTKFLIYRDLRSRGYVVKDGFGFGSDFRVYERSHFGEKGAKYVVFGLGEGRQRKMGEIKKQISQISRMGKEPIIAVIERRGEVIYYKVSEMAFYENQSRVRQQVD